MAQKVFLKCPSCKSIDIIKAGRVANNAQRYKCQGCGKKWQSKYKYKAYLPEASTEKMTSWLMRNVGIRAVAEELGIAKDTVGNRLKKTSRKTESIL